MKPEQLHILQHSLGLDQYAQGSMYRNRYVCDPNPDVVELCAGDLMQDFGPQRLMGGMHYYEVFGLASNIALLPPPKLSRSQKRYRAFLRADCGMTFIEWLKASANHERLSR